MCLEWGECGEGGDEGREVLGVPDILDLGRLLLRVGANKSDWNREVLLLLFVCVFLSKQYAQCGA